MQPPGSLSPRPTYMPDLQNLNTTVPASNQLALAFETGGGPFDPGPPFPVMHINGKAFGTKVSDMRLDTVACV
jgi:hypothetical protein